MNVICVDIQSFKTDYGLRLLRVNTIKTTRLIDSFLKDVMKQLS